jgi:hypothetical protein
LNLLRRLFSKTLPIAPGPDSTSARAKTPDVQDLENRKDVKGLLKIGALGNDVLTDAAAKALEEIDLNSRLSEDSYCVEAVTFLSLYHRDAELFEKYSLEVTALKARGQSVGLFTAETLMMDYHHKRSISEVNLRYIGLRPQTSTEARELMEKIADDQNGWGRQSPAGGACPVHFRKKRFTKTMSVMPRVFSASHFERQGFTDI